MLRARSVWYRGLGKRFTFGLNSKFGYGDGYGDLRELPFYKNFYAGGARSVRGFEGRSLGPRSKDPSKDALGGSKRIVFGGELKFPVPGMLDSSDKRLALFLDAGQVYASGESVDLGDLRYASGIAFEWMTVIGPLAFSYAVPLNEEPDDDLEQFQFTLGGLFR